ncbi:DUF4232 domain-containing protein [Streptomyces griseoruber]|uniref:DUF4232 domain-containing protein n=1 Tax=Streptomyces griseoruber TaxID=1943 RepID=A0A101TB91_9ACTN|nr:DUF4232 domain-containing protein [Streptomyces griseoruber]KUN89208.1 hypothetical protein AQJ64_00570 [Streptomyces griseoruber]
MRPPRRPRPVRLLPAVAAVLLLATACGTERAGGDLGGDGVGAASRAPRTPVTAPPVDGVRVTAVTIPSAPSAPSSTPTPSASDRIVHADRPADDSGVSAAYEVTNDGTEALTYSVLFDFTTSAGEVMSNQWVTVRDVGAGKTVRGTVEPGALAPGASPVTTVKVAEVRKVPAAEAPAQAGVCPSSGIRVTADDGDAAMGLRVVGLRLENCGTRDYTLDGYPRLTLLDEDREPVEGVRILHGGDSITTGTGLDDPPRAFTLEPGESAVSGLVWRNTTEAGRDPVNVPYVRIRAQSGAAPVTITPRLDLGTTGRLGVGAWKPAER